MTVGCWRVVRNLDPDIARAPREEGRLTAQHVARSHGHRPKVADMNDIAEVIQGLIQRPRALSAEKPPKLPVLLFDSVDQAAAETVEQIATLLEDAAPRSVPHARPLAPGRRDSARGAPALEEADPHPADVSAHGRPMRLLLRRVVEELSERNKRRFGCYRFPRYWLMSILTGLDQPLAPGPGSSDADLAEKIRRNMPGQRAASALATVGEGAGQALGSAGRFALAGRQLPKGTWRFIFWWRLRTNIRWWGGAYY